MNSTTDCVQIEALLQQLIQAHAARNADAIVDAYSSDAVIYDLAPPLGRRGMNRDRVFAWLQGWDSSVPFYMDASYRAAVDLQA